jgi:hypothetical protein
MPLSVHKVGRLCSSCFPWDWVQCLLFSCWINMQQYRIFDLHNENYKNAPIGFAIAVCVHSFTWEQLNTLYWLWYCRVVLSVVDPPQFWLKIYNSNGHLVCYMCFSSHHKCNQWNILLNWKVHQTKVVEEDEAHILCPVHCFHKPLDSQNKETNQWEPTCQKC